MLARLEDRCSSDRNLLIQLGFFLRFVDGVEEAIVEITLRVPAIVNPDVGGEVEDGKLGEGLKGWSKVLM